MTAAAPEVRTLAELEAMVADAAGKSHAANTKETYVKALRALARFCDAHGLTPVIPTTTRVLGLWAAEQVSRGLAPSTIKTWTSAIRSLHTRPALAGLPEPAEPYPVPALTDVEKVVRRHSRALADAGWKPAKAEAMLLADLRRIKRHMAPEGYFPRPIDLRDWVILTLGFAMGARRSELECLDIDDVALDPDDPQWMMIRICSSKTDQSGNGEVVMIRRANDHTVCAVAAVLDWLTWLKMHGITHGPLLRQIAGGGTSLTVHGRAAKPEAIRGRLSGQAISKRYSKRSLDAEIPGFAGQLKRFTGHSGRRGGATEAARHGATHEQMCSHFRWAAGSAMAAQYVDQADKRQHNPMAAVM